jgi:hypothetical protein
MAGGSLDVARYSFHWLGRVYSLTAALKFMADGAKQTPTSKRYLVKAGGDYSLMAAHGLLF